MKRLIKKAFGTTLYHGTDTNKLRQITESGMLMPNEATGAGSIAENDGRNFEGFTFMATTLERGWYYSRVGNPNNFDNFQIVLELDVPEDSLMPDDDDCPTCKTWQDSARNIEQVKVLGSITDNYFKKVHFNEKVVFNYSNWEDELEEYLENLDQTKQDSENFHDDLDTDWDNDVELELEEDDDLLDPDDLEAWDEEYFQALSNAGLNPVRNEDEQIVCTNVSFKQFLDITIEQEMDGWGKMDGTLSVDGDVLMTDGYVDIPRAATMNYDGNTLAIKSEDNFGTLTNPAAAISNFQIVNGDGAFKLNGKDITFEELSNVINGQQAVASTKSRLKKQAK